MSETCATVAVEADNEDGYMIINESDFDPDIHKKTKPKIKKPATDEGTDDIAGKKSGKSKG